MSAARREVSPPSRLAAALTPCRDGRPWCQGRVLGRGQSTASSRAAAGCKLGGGRPGLGGAERAAFRRRLTASASFRTTLSASAPSRSHTVGGASMGARPSVTESGDGSRARGARHRFRGVAESPCGDVTADSASRRSVASPGVTVLPPMGMTAMTLPPSSRRNCGASRATSSGTPVPRHGSQRDLTSVDSDRMMVNLGGVRCISAAEIVTATPATGHRGRKRAGRPRFLGSGFFALSQASGGAAGDVFIARIASSVSI